MCCFKCGLYSLKWNFLKNYEWFALYEQKGSAVSFNYKLWFLIHNSQYRTYKVVVDPQKDHILRSRIP